MDKKVRDDFSNISYYAHWCHWEPDWNLAEEIYEKFPMSYSILIPFAFSYLEDLIRSTTSNYEIPVANPKDQQNWKPVGKKLFELAKKENEDKPEYLKELKKLEKYFTWGDWWHLENNLRNHSLHGIQPPSFWSKEMFETLIHDIANISKFSRF